jgi:TAT (twin-arginine translocation) pathway signal sequence
MKTLREYINQLDEISRRDFIKGAGATAGLAAMGAPGLALANSPYINSFTYQQIDKIIAQSLFLYNYTKDWQGNEQIARQMMQHINNYLAIKPGQKSVVERLYDRIQQLTNDTKQNNPERYNTQRNSSLKHVDNLNLSWQFIFDNFKNNQTPTNENVEQDVDETATPDAVKRIEQLVQYK